MGSVPSAPMRTRRRTLPPRRQHGWGLIWTWVIMGLAVACILAAYFPKNPGALLAGDEAVVSRVVDADTVVTTAGDHVRVLGIDACEMQYPGGVRARDAARPLLEGQTVRLSAQFGAPDRDPWGRALRYVQLPDGRDFGEVIVVRRDVGLYRDGDPGKNDASLDYLARLREAELRAGDTAPRFCEL
jgi:endonuclease YncB( thermonuclease family)